MSDNKGLKINNRDLNIESTDSCSCSSEPCATVKTVVEPLTEQNSVTPAIIPAGPVFVKLPVVLAETNITIPVEATIKLDQPAREIKRIRKNVFLTQSRLIPFSSTPVAPNTGILFIAGFVRKNIEYATQSCITAGTPNFCGDIRQCTVEVPFNFTARVTFLRTPIFAENTTPSELEFFTDQLESCDFCADPVLGRNPCDQSFLFTENFNEKPFVELINAVVTEVDIHKRPIVSRATPTEQFFNAITEKLVVNLTLKLLQKQQVRVQALGL